MLYFLEALDVLEFLDSDLTLLVFYLSDDKLLETTVNGFLCASIILGLSWNLDCIANPWNDVLALTIIEFFFSLYLL